MKKNIKRNIAISGIILCSLLLVLGIYIQTVPDYIIEIDNKYVELTPEKLYELSDLIVLANISTESKDILIEKNNISAKQYEVLVKETYKGAKKDKVNILQLNKLDDLKIKNNNEILLFLRIDETTGEYRITGGMQGFFEYNSEKEKYFNNNDLMFDKHKIVEKFEKLDNK